MESAGSRPSRWSCRTLSAFSGCEERYRSSSPPGAAASSGATAGARAARVLRRSSSPHRREGAPSARSSQRAGLRIRAREELQQRFRRVDGKRVAGARRRAAAAAVKAPCLRGLVKWGKNVTVPARVASRRTTRDATPSSSRDYDGRSHEGVRARLKECRAQGSSASRGHEGAAAKAWSVAARAPAAQVGILRGMRAGRRATWP